MNSISYWDADKFEEDIGSLITSFNSLFVSEIAVLLSNPNGDRKKSMKGLISLDVAKIQRNLYDVIYKIEGELKSYALIILSEHKYSEHEAKLFIADHFHSGLLSHK